ncbi:hypothetical protein FJTKL_04647 [Diaporthe vaccinii]|uniref:Uncharacterized protein n=1 Tax=Diaporthe vaccinii TaxID=105482 RepID=A0ABR4EZG8_9PEZI
MYLIVVVPKTANSWCSGTGPYIERSSSGCNIDGCAAPSDDSTTGRNTQYYNSGCTTANHLHHIDGDTTAIKLGQPVSYITDSQPVHRTGGTAANDPASADEPSQLCIDCCPILGVDLLSLIDVAVIVGWVDECSGRGGGIIDHISRLHWSCYFIGIAIGAGTALVLLIILAAAAVIVWRRKSSRKRPRESDLQLITRDVAPPRNSFHAHSEPGDAESDIRAVDEPWAMSGAPPMTEEVSENNRGVSWFQLPMPVLARSSLSSTLSRPGPATSLHSHPLARRSTAPSIPQHDDRRSSGGVPRVVRKSSSRSPPRVSSPSSGSVDRQARVSDPASLGSLSSEAERHLAVDHGGSLGAEAGGDLHISRRGSGSSNREEQRQPVNLLPVFQQPMYVQLAGSSGAIVELI